MALQMDVNFKGLLIEDAYLKITEIKFAENGNFDEEDNKLYYIRVALDTYPTSEKISNINRERYTLQDFLLSDCTIENAYIALKALPKYSTATDV